MDEFTSGLDRSSGKDIRSFIVHLQEIFGFICINITHTLEDARYFSGQILYLDSEQKEIIEIASVAELAEYL
ncbi:hypothetical protein [Eubacterium aggregans]|uniref:hypothetical protein n=1 Tax=Eubacterium aggregans TaxID=81409 RepID=UPI003F39878C